MEGRKEIENVIRMNKTLYEDNLDNTNEDKYAFDKMMQNRRK